MTRVPFVAVLASFGGASVSAESSKTYVGVITDTMCATDHKPMRVARVSTS